MSQIDIQQINGLPFGRAYKVTDNGVSKYLPSVTTVLKLNEDPFIQQLRDELGEEGFKKIQERGSNRGTIMHRWLEIFLESYATSSDASKALRHVQEYMSTTDEFRSMSELDRAKKIGRNLFYNFYNAGFYNTVKKILFNEIFMYTFFRGGCAGTCDFVYIDNEDRLVILDFKSSSIPKQEDHVENYKMQTSVYMFMYAELYGILPDRGEIVISNEQNDELQYIIVSRDDMKIYLRQFLALLKEFKQTPDWVEFDEKVNCEIDI